MRRTGGSADLCRMGKCIAREDVRSALDRLTKAIATHCRGREYFLVGIANGGIELTEIVSTCLPERPAWGVLNALFHRDDVGLKPIPKNFHQSNIGFPIDDATVVLIDDVFATGRTVRAALNELFDHGRPREVLLGVLVDTGLRRLPIRPDFVGIELSPSVDEVVAVTVNGTDADSITIALEAK